jgi:hypothetical protein
MSKGRSSILQKDLYQRKQSYTPQQRLDYKACPCDGAKKVPAWLLDKIADEKLTGNFNVRRSNQCRTCFQVKSSNGSCGC